MITVISSSLPSPSSLTLEALAQVISRALAKGLPTRPWFEACPVPYSWHHLKLVWSHFPSALHMPHASLLQIAPASDLLFLTWQINLPSFLNSPLESSSHYPAPGYLSHLAPGTLYLSAAYMAFTSTRFILAQWAGHRKS